MVIYPLFVILSGAGLLCYTVFASAILSFASAFLYVFPWDLGYLTHSYTMLIGDIWASGVE